MDAHALLSYLNSYASGAPALVRGTSEAEIQALQALVPRPLPSCYCTFLRALGHEHGGLDLLGEISVDYECVYDHYRDCIATGEETLPADLIQIGVGVSYDLFLAAQEDGPPKVLMGEPDDPLLLAESLAHLLFRAVFVQKALAARPEQIGLSGNSTDLGEEQRLQQVRAMGRVQGLETLWFSDDVAYCGEGPGLLLYAEQAEGAGMLVKVGADAPLEAHRIAALVADEVGVRRID